MILTSKKNRQVKLNTIISKPIHINTSNKFGGHSVSYSSSKSNSSIIDATGNTTPQTTKKKIQSQIIIENLKFALTKKIKTNSSISSKSQTKNYQSATKKQKILRNPNMKMHANINTQFSKSKQMFKGSCICSHGLSTFRGLKDNINSHYNGVHLGRFKHYFLVQGFDGIAATNFVRHQYPAIIHQEIQQKYHSQADPIVIIQQIILNSFAKLNSSLKNEQQKIKDNSGCTLISVLISDQIVFVANCGLSQVYCQTMKGKVLKMCNKHSTQNRNEIKRINEIGGKFYQTAFKVETHKLLAITGPIRLFPSGLTITRGLGKNLTPLSQEVSYISTPQIYYINSNQLQWLLIHSSNITLPIKEITNLINREITASLRSIHEITGICSKQIVNNAIRIGVKESISVQLLVLNHEEQFQLDSNFNLNFQGLSKNGGSIKGQIRSRKNTIKSNASNIVSQYSYRQSERSYKQTKKSNDAYQTENKYCTPQIGNKGKEIKRKLQKNKLIRENDYIEN